MSRYTEAHAEPKGPGDARPTAMQIIKDEAAEGTLKGQFAVITGVSSGLGIETTRALASTGAFLFLTARDIPKAETALAGVFDPSCMEIIQMDQTSFESIRNAATAILAKTSKIHLLINNAGVMSIPDRRLTADGHELQFGTNHLSHFLFYKLLEPALLASASTIPSRVVNLSSSGHNFYALNDSDNYDFQKGGYVPQVAYAQSKTANIYMANEIERRHGTKGLHGFSLHPGIISTGLARHMPPDAFAGMEWIHPIMKNVEQGAATTVWAAVSKELDNKGGLYLSECSIAKPHEEGKDKISSSGYAPHAYDVEAAKKLWDDSLKLVGLTEE